MHRKTNPEQMAQSISKLVHFLRAVVLRTAAPDVAVIEASATGSGGAASVSIAASGVSVTASGDHSAHGSVKVGPAMTPVRIQKHCYVKDGRNFGRFSPKRRLNEDAVPVNLDLSARRTYVDAQMAKDGVVPVTLSDSCHQVLHRSGFK